MWFRPKKILCFGQPDPTYRNRPTLDFFLRKYPFFVGVFIIKVSILKKKTRPTLPQVFKTVALNTRLFFLALLRIRCTMYFMYMGHKVYNWSQSLTLTLNLGASKYSKIRLKGTHWDHEKLFLITEVPYKRA